MSADTGAVDAAVLNSCMKDNSSIDPVEVAYAEFWAANDRGENDIDRMRAAIQAFQRANAERVTALVDELIEKANADHTEHEAVLYWNGNDRDEIERHAALSSRIDTLNEVKALLKTVVGEVGM